MKKLLTLLTVVGLTTTTTSTVIACKSDNKIQLDSVLTNLTVASDTTIDNVIDVVLSLPENSAFDVLEKANLEVQAGSFVAPTYTNHGSVVIKVKKGSKKYTGSVEVTINKLDQIDLGSVLTNLTVASDTTIDIVIDNVLEQNSAFDVSERVNLEVESGSFVAPDYGKTGSAVIVAKAGTKYTGSVKVIISSLDISNTEIEKIMNEIRNYSGSKTDLAYVNLFENFFASIIDLYKENYQVVLTQQQYDEIQNENANTVKTITMSEFQKLMDYINNFATAENFIDLINEKWNSPEISSNTPSIVLKNDQKLDFQMLVLIHAKITGGIVDTIYISGIRDVSFVVN